MCFLSSFCHFANPFLPQKLCLSVISKVTVLFCRNGILQARPSSSAAAKLESDAERCSCATVAAGTGATPAAFYLGLCRLRGIQSPPASATASCRRNRSPLRQRRIESDADLVAATATAGGLFFFAAMQKRIGRRTSLPLRHCRRAIPHCSSDDAASIRKSGLEIKNRCTQEGVNRQNLASISKSGLEIKNRCTQDGVNRQNPASIPKSGLEIKNRCTKEGVNGEKLASIPKSRLEIKNRCRM